MGEPLHSLVICGDMHDIEEEMYEFFHYKTGHYVNKGQQQQAVEDKEWPE